MYQMSDRSACWTDETVAIFVLQDCAETQIAQTRFKEILFKIDKIETII